MRVPDDRRTRAIRDWRHRWSARSAFWIGTRSRATTPFRDVWHRRDVLKLGASIAAGGVARRWSPRARRRTERHRRRRIRRRRADALAGPITLLAGGDPGTEPALQKVYDDFKAHHPGIEWDIRALPGGGPEWDRLARAAIDVRRARRPRDDQRADSSRVGAGRPAGGPRRGPGAGRRPRARAGAVPPRRARRGDHAAFPAAQ